MVKDFKISVIFSEALLATDIVYVSVAVRDETVECYPFHI
jgi:hypothetical protein